MKNKKYNHKTNLRKEKGHLLHNINSNLVNAFFSSNSKGTFDQPTVDKHL